MKYCKMPSGVSTSGCRRDSIFKAQELTPSAGYVEPTWQYAKRKELEQNGGSSHWRGFIWRIFYMINQIFYLIH